MISLLFMKVFAGGEAACWAKALEATTVARNVKARNCARMRVPPIISRVLLGMGKQPPLSLQGANSICAAHSTNLSSVIPGRGLLPASPESITPMLSVPFSPVVMDSGFAQERAPE